MNSKVLLIIGLVWPEPNSSAAGKRMMQLILMFKNWDYNIIFASTALENSYNFDLNRIGVRKSIIELNSESFDEFIKSIDPSVVLFDRFSIEEQFGWRVSKNCPNALKILDTEDLHCLRNTRSLNFKRNIPFSIENLFEEDVSKREIASILRSDLTLIVAEFEMEILTNYFKIDQNLLFYIPILFHDHELNFQFPDTHFRERNDFVFIGNFWHEPNWDAVLYLKKTIWPLIRMQLPKAVIRIYGAYPSQKVFDLNNKNEGFLVLGRADDAQKVIAAARLLLAPLRFGAGIKGKLLEAMQFGTPSVTTSIGAESINGVFEWNGFIADEPNDIATNAALLYENEILWMEAQRKGIDILKNRFQFDSFEPIFKNRIGYLLANLRTHRNGNFLGALLSHHSLKSTEYMSRWIEEKNKKTEI